MSNPLLCRLLTREEVASILRIHASTVSRLVKSRELTALRIGKRPMFRSEDVKAFIDNRIGK